MIKNNRLNVFTGIILLMVMVLLPSISAFEFDNVKDYTPEPKPYGTVEIKNSFGFGEVLEKATLLDNTETCDRFCEANKEITLYSSGALVDKLDFYRIFEDGSRELSNIRNYKLEYYGSIDDYETQCKDGETIYNEINGTSYTTQVCEQVKIGSHEGWIEFKEGQIFNAGTYLVKLSGEKRSGWSYDWVPTLSGKQVTEWATWGNISTGSQAEVILNSPANNSIQYTRVVTTNATANVTNGAYLVNATLYDNSTGSWGARNTSLGSEYLFNESNISYTQSGLTYSSKANYSTYNLNVTKVVTDYLISSPYANYKGGAKIRFWYPNGSYYETTEQQGTQNVWVTLTFNNPSNLSVNKIELLIRGDYNAGQSASYTGTVNRTKTYLLFLGTNNTVSFSNNYATGSNIKWNYQFCDSDGACGFATSNYTFTIDNVAPTINLNYPTSLINYGAINQTLQLNFTATDTNLDKVWYNYNGTNITILGATSGVVNLSNITLSSKKNVTIYANDTAGNLNTTTFSWDYKISENYINYTNVTIEGSVNLFRANFTTTISGIQSAILRLNGDSYYLSIEELNNSLIVYTNITTPLVDTVTQKSFNITLLYNDTNITTDNLLLSIYPADIHRCNSTINNTIMNISVRDETTKSLMASNNLTMSLYWLNGETNLGTNYLSVGNNTSYSLCSSQNLSSSAETIYLAGKIVYFANNYSTEEYNFDEKQINSKNISNISLYLLNSSLSTTYLVEVKDSNALYLENTITRLYRIYQTEANTTLLVEAPLTNSLGQVSLHAISESEKYNIGIFSLEGVLLQFFDNYVFTCDNPLTTACRASIKLSVDPRLDVSLSQLYDILFYDPVVSNTGTITVSYSVPSGNAANIKVKVNQVDMFGNSTPCENTVYSASGTITCNYDPAIGESKLQVQFFKNDLLLMQKGYKVSDTPEFEGNNLILAFILLLSLVGMAFSSPEWIVVNAVVTFLIAGSLWLLSGMELVVGLGGLAWLFIAAGILIFKLAETDK